MSIVDRIGGVNDRMQSAFRNSMGAPEIIHQTAAESKITPFKEPCVPEGKADIRANKEHASGLLPVPIAPSALSGWPAKQSI